MNLSALDVQAELLMVSQFTDFSRVRAGVSGGVPGTALAIAAAINSRFSQ
jgi:D-Tyr-tRNAtyr deacylase